MGINDETFATTRSQILARDPLPYLDTIFNIIQQEENHKKVMIGRDHRSENMLAFAAQEQAMSTKDPHVSTVDVTGMRQPNAMKLQDTHRAGELEVTDMVVVEADPTEAAETSLGVVEGLGVKQWQPWPWPWEQLP